MILRFHKISNIFISKYLSHQICLSNVTKIDFFRVGSYCGTRLWSFYLLPYHLLIFIVLSIGYITLWLGGFQIKLEILLLKQYLNQEKDLAVQIKFQGRNYWDAIYANNPRSFYQQLRGVSTTFVIIALQQLLSRPAAKTFYAQTATHH